MKLYLYQVRITSLVISLLILINLTSTIFAREEIIIDRSSNAKMKIISDKAFHDSIREKFSAVGNVIISMKSDTLYGEKANIDYKSGDITINGNVRYVGIDSTVYGDKIEYNTKTKLFKIYDSKIIFNSFSIKGKLIKKISPINYLIENGEYSTCKDCPESWSFYGGKIEVINNNYVFINNSILKVKNIPFFYFPYIMFPIKKERETGLLFPKISFNTLGGNVIQLPWFWNISKSMDLTFTPSFFSKNGFGVDLQFRHYPTYNFWYEFNNITLFNSKLGNSSFQHFTQYEQHYFYKSLLNSHLYLSKTKDLELMANLYNYLRPYKNEPYNGFETFLDFRFDNVSFSIEAYNKRSTINEDSLSFYNDLVQIMPSISMSSTYIPIFQNKSSLISKINFLFESNFSVFRQNIFNENIFIRNATRLSVKPQLEFIFKPIGALHFKTEFYGDGQSYFFEKLHNDKYFSKLGVVLQNMVSIHGRTVFGKSSYQETKLSKENISKKYNELSNKSNRKLEINEFQNYIGILPNYDLQVNSIKVIKSIAHILQMDSYLKHFYLTKQSNMGNQTFFNQIKTKEGQFDSFDILKSREYQSELGKVSKVEIPVNNALEYFIKFRVIEKSVNKEDTYSFIERSSISFSQGYDFNIRSLNYKDKLTRLKINFNLKLHHLNFNVADIYHYASDTNLLNVGLGLNFSSTNISSSYVIDTLKDDYTKLFNFGIGVRFNDYYQISSSFKYDIKNSLIDSFLFNLNYSPLNNCWKLGVSHEVKANGHATKLNILLNFNNDFQTLKL